jgi:hypothetical protein
MTVVFCYPRKRLKSVPTSYASSEWSSCVTKHLIHSNEKAPADWYHFVWEELFSSAVSYIYQTKI